MTATSPELPICPLTFIGVRSGIRFPTHFGAAVIVLSCIFVSFACQPMAVPSHKLNRQFLGSSTSQQTAASKTNPHRALTAHCSVEHHPFFKRPAVQDYVAPSCHPTHPVWYGRSKKPRQSLPSSIETQNPPTLQGASHRVNPLHYIPPTLQGATAYCYPIVAFACCPAGGPAFFSFPCLFSKDIYSKSENLSH